MAQHYKYEKYNEEKQRMEHASHFTNDVDGSITGHIVMDVASWFDENPEERTRLGWIKHIWYDKPEDAGVEFNQQTQFYVIETRTIDEYTVEDVYHVKDKSEDQLLFEQMLSIANNGYEGYGGITFIGGEF